MSIALEQKVQELLRRVTELENLVSAMQTALGTLCIERDMKPIPDEKRHGNRR